MDIHWFEILDFIKGSMATILSGKLVAKRIFLQTLSHRILFCYFHEVLFLHRYADRMVIRMIVSVS